MILFIQTIMLMLSIQIADISFQIDSDVVEFVYVSLNRTIDTVTVSWLFHNIANRTLNLSIKAEFYDKNGNMLFSKVNELLKFPANYTEHLLLPANKISYNGKNILSARVILRIAETVYVAEMSMGQIYIYEASIVEKF